MTTPIDSASPRTGPGPRLLGPSLTGPAPPHLDSANELRPK
ncbi:hypothetical protein [Glycomyces sp. NPDC048151]